MKNLFSNLKGDLLGGITAGIVALPLALAFGLKSGLGPEAGLYGAIFIAFFASLFGGTSTQISGPTAPMTAVSMVVISGIIATFNDDIEKALPVILSVFLLGGLFQIILGLLKLGKYIRYIPYPVVSGFMTAIGVVILITQILPAVGYYPKEDIKLTEQFREKAKEVIIKSSLDEKKKKDEKGILKINHLNETVAHFQETTEKDIIEKTKILAGEHTAGVIGTFKILPRALKNINWLEFGLVIGTILIIYGFKRITTAVPSTLVALVIMTLTSRVFKLDYRTIKEIPGGLPIPKWEIFTTLDIGNITPYIFTAFTLALLGAIDSLLTSVVADNMTKTKHKPNKELIGQGIGNSIGAIFGGIPGAGATIRTVVNINSGGKTKISGMIAGIMLLIIMLALGPIASKIPAAVLAGILITVGIGVMDYKGLKAIPSLPKDIKLGPIKLSSDVLIMLIVLVLSSVWNLVYAVGIGLVIASLMFMKKIGDLTADRSEVTTLKEEEWSDEVNFPADYNEEVFIKHVNGPLFFGSTSDFQALVEQIPSTAKHAVIRLDRMHYMDQSGLYAIEDMLQDLKGNNVEVLFVGLAKQPRYMMERIDIIPDFIPESHIFINFEECINWIKQNVKH